jgi:hypothetical protein
VPLAEASRRAGASAGLAMKGSRMRLIYLALALLLAPAALLALLVLALTLGDHAPARWLDAAEQQLSQTLGPDSLALQALAPLRELLDEPSAQVRQAEAPSAPPPPPRWAAVHEPPVRSDGARVLRVGPAERLTRIAQAAREARDGDVVEIAAGDYRGDVAVWLQRRLSIRSVGGNARLWADGQSAEGKAIWVIRNGQFDISGIDFIGVRVPDRNGAGIRFEGGSLRVRNCLFWDSESGILTGGGAGKQDMTLDVEASEFGHLGFGDGYSHAIYAGAIGRLRVSHSHFHHGRVGHLVKSRAAFTQLSHNRLSDEQGGRSSYEVDLPNGGVAVLVGNLVQQSRRTENSALISFGAEGYRHADNRLYLIGNTLVNELPLGGAFLRVADGAQAAVALNNLLVGPGRLQGGGALEQANNPRLSPQDFVDPEHHDYRLREDPAHARLQWLAPALAEVGGVSLVPSAQYQHPRSLRRLDRPPRWPGAFQDAAAP